jgi:hypothetical protein
MQKSEIHPVTFITTKGLHQINLSFPLNKNITIYKYTSTSSIYHLRYKQEYLRFSVSTAQCATTHPTNNIATAKLARLYTILLNDHTCQTHKN